MREANKVKHGEDDMQQAVSIDRAEGWLEVGSVEDIPRQGARVVRLAGGDVAVFRAADDTVFALRDRCPHKGGPLSQGIVHGHKVTCPLHNWNIHLDTGLAAAPDEGCAARYPVRVAQGRIYLGPTPAP
jgi:nitrite reductase (NADH) small subunit